MTTREEIKESIDTHANGRCLFPDRVCNAFRSGYCSSGWEVYRCLMEKLTLLGVVLKIEGKLPEWLEYDDSGLVAVEPLIKEGYYVSARLNRHSCWKGESE